ncbi:methyltransferase domain-containing protein [Rhizobium sp. LjRoot30]|uniref:class I SAM-dependent methyltransferase n=1 Tax=Rhizobium sp. LjRoot30 TaxID=3342320 RepID=UPI003ECFEAD6
MRDDRLYNDAGLAQFYDLDNDWSDDLSFCRRLAEGCRSVLDLGCGTGRFAAEIATTVECVVGADPARPMLDIARQRPGGERVRWVEADARAMRLGSTFDLVVLTGHAFQVFLTRADRLAVLKTIAAHLAPEGRFVFDSRNPLLAEWREWTPALSQRDIEHPHLGTVASWNDVRCDEQSGIVTYQTFYRAAGGQTWQAASDLAFASQAEIAELAKEAELVVERWLGDWHGASCDDTSPEIIPIGRLG